MAQAVMDLVASFGSCLGCLGGSPALQIDGRSLKILRLLGEGGFSYVYLVEDTTTSEKFALKKIRCPFGPESLQHALLEVAAYNAFSSLPNIIRAHGHLVATERAAGEESKTVYVLLPYYAKGNLQDVINRNLIEGTEWPEKDILRIFAGVCRGVRGLHEFGKKEKGKGKGKVKQSGGGRKMGKMHMGDDTEIISSSSESDSDSNSDSDSGSDSGSSTHHQTAGSSASHQTTRHQQQPLMSNNPSIFTTATSFAHRDIKPGNIMLTDSHTPILMDLGSIAPSPITATTSSAAIAIQDLAAEHCTMPYRAPELFLVETGATITTAVDIWSLGCTLFACLVGKSPFEMRSDETGGTLSLCVQGGDWRWPDEGGMAKRTSTGMRGADNRGSGAAGSGERVVSDEVKNIVKRCLVVEPAERPDIGELIRMVDDVLVTL